MPHSSAHKVMQLQFVFQHSPSNPCKSKCTHEIFCLGAQQGFGQNVGSHFVGGAIGDFDIASLNDVSDVMVPDVNVFCTGMVVPILSESDGRLVVIVKHHGFRWSKDFHDELAQPHGFLGSMHGSNIFSLHY